MNLTMSPKLRPSRFKCQVISLLICNLLWKFPRDSVPKSVTKLGWPWLSFPAWCQGKYNQMLCTHLQLGNWRADSWLAEFWTRFSEPETTVPRPLQLSCWVMLDFETRHTFLSYTYFFGFLQNCLQANTYYIILPQTEVRLPWGQCAVSETHQQTRTPRTASPGEDWSKWYGRQESPSTRLPGSWKMPSCWSWEDLGSESLVKLVVESPAQ